MKKMFSLIGACVFFCLIAMSQQLPWPKNAATDSVVLANSIPLLSRGIITNHKDDNQKDHLNILFRAQMLAGDYTASLQTIASLREIGKKENNPAWAVLHIQYELYAKAKQQQLPGEPFAVAFSRVFDNYFQNLNDLDAANLHTAFLTRNGIEELAAFLQNSLQKVKDKSELTVPEAIDVCKSYFILAVYRDIEPVSKYLSQKDDERRYSINDSLLIKTKDGAIISALTIRPRKMASPQPAVLFFTIYTDTIQQLNEARQSAARGFIGVVANTRGKHLSPGPIEPYEHEPTDVNEVIDWISKQTWCNGKIGMYGGSYVGYAQWAATKHLHPALKTIVPYVAAIPGLGLPMENNIFLNANYGWAFYVTHNKYLDNETYFDRQRWDTLPFKWFESGVAFRKTDSIDHAPNKWLQRWLQHPSYDRYWQSMVPYKNEYAKIDIPVLSVTGYYDDGQISALHYLREHYKYNPNAEHYLIIGPYDHWGAQRGGVPVLRDYAVDPVALIDTRAITYQWLDHILRGGPKPAMVKDKVNFQVMGSNEWKHAGSVKAMGNGVMKLYLSDLKKDSNYQLPDKKPLRAGYIQQVVDLADRATSSNDGYYPFPIIGDELENKNGLHFITEPFKDPFEINGMFSCELKVMINKKDMDIGITLYEITPEGRYFHLSYMLCRASHAKDMSKRQLLIPNKLQTISFDRSRMVSRRIGKGSRLLVVLDINKNPFAQVNHGTGKDVSDETINDAGEALKIKWYSDSYLSIPVWRYRLAYR